MATLRYRNRFCFLFFFFSQIYTIDGGCVVLSAQLSEHVTIGQGRLNQSGIDTLRSFSRSGPRALHCGFVRDRKSISLPTYIYTYFPLHAAALCRIETNFNTNKRRKSLHRFNSIATGL